MLAIITVLHFLALINNCFGLKNVSVSERSARIVFVGNWTLRNDSLSSGGSYMLALDGNATATLTFTGVALFYSTPKWPFAIRTSLSLDNGTRFTVLDLQDGNATAERNSSATTRSNPIALWTNLTNEEHFLRISVPTGEQQAIVDNIIYSEEERNTSSSTISSRTSLSSATILAPNTLTYSTTALTQRPPDRVTTDPVAGTITVTINAVAQSTVEVPAPDAQSSVRLNKRNNAKKYGIIFGILGGLIVIFLLIGHRLWSIRQREKLEEAAGGSAMADRDLEEELRLSERRKRLARRTGSDSFAGSISYYMPETQLEPFELGMAPVEEEEVGRDYRQSSYYYGDRTTAATNRPTAESVKPLPTSPPAG